MTLENTAVKLRKVTTGDVKALHEISRKTFLDAFAHLNTAESMQAYLVDNLTVEKLSSEINNPGSEFYFAEINNEVIGYIKLNTGTAQTELQDKNGSEVERIYVTQGFQGQNIGRLLLNKSLAIAKNERKDYIWLGVWEKNEKAIRFYKRNGFIPFDAHVFILGNEAQTDIMMKLELHT